MSRSLTGWPRGGPVGRLLARPRPRGDLPSALALVPVVVFVVSTLPHVRSAPGYNLLLDGFLNNIAYLAAPVVCLRRSRRLTGPARTFGRLLGAALVVYGGGNIVWTIAIRPLDPEPFPSYADAGFLAFYPLAFVALMVAQRGRSQGHTVTQWLDGLVAGLAVSAAAAAVLARPLATTIAGSWAAVATTAAYPLLDLVLVLVLVTVLSLYRWRPPLGVWFLSVGLVLFVYADVVYLLATANDTYQPGGVNDGVWVSGVVCMAFAPGWPHRPRGVRLPTWATLAVPIAAAGICMGLLVVDHVADLEPLTVALAVGTIALVLLRMTLTLVEVDNLAHSRALALTDELTGMGNRRALYEAAGRCFGDAGHGGVALMLLDLDRFKEINDSLGHSAGDAMLKIVADRLRGCVGTDRVVARLGGDEFAVLGAADDRAEVEGRARELRTVLEEPVRIGGVTVWVGASVGIAWAVGRDADLGVLLRQADVAMYAAKSSRTGVVTYSEQVDTFAGRDRLEMIDQLRGAILGGDLTLHYQPKIDTRSHRVRGVEALVRWQHPTKGLLAPDSFLGLAEEVGLMGLLTAAVLRQALDQAAVWHRRGRHLPVAVNLSASSLVDLELAGSIERLLLERSLPPSCLEIEITEEFLVADRGRAHDILGQLKALGIRLAVDDYGTGYSSLAYLKELPVDELKLDRSFIRDMRRDSRSMAIVASTIGLAHSLGMDLVAEGVEDEETASDLAAADCDVEQGWLYARALPADELASWLERHEAETGLPDLLDPPARPAPTDLDASPGIPVGDHVPA